MKSSTSRRDETARLTALLDRRTGELAVARRGLARETQRRKSVETDLGVSEILHGELLERALLMEERLRLLLDRALAETPNHGADGRPDGGNSS